jgi:hypothetical protein
LLALEKHGMHEVLRFIKKTGGEFAGWARATRLCEARSIHLRKNPIHPDLSRRPAFPLSEPNPPGLQGHEPIPKKGETATFYLTGGGKKPFEPITPNGIVIYSVVVD